ncbi:MAG TPA: hypothetical protein VF960_06755 [Chloroflexota bacterium]
MTHTLHRRGERESLATDYVFTSMAARAHNMPGAAEQFNKFFAICARHNPEYMGDLSRGNELLLGRENLMISSIDKSFGQAVYRDVDTVAEVLKELIDEGFDRSVVIAGLFDEVEKCCQKVGIGTPHTIEWSLGTWGDDSLMASKDDLEIMTMCGHAQIPGALIRHLAQRVKEGKIGAEEASKKMARQCTCGVFNIGRGAELLSAIAAKL